MVESGANLGAILPSYFRTPPNGFPCLRIAREEVRVFLRRPGASRVLAHFVFAEAEVVSDLVDDGLSDLLAKLVRREIH